MKKFIKNILLILIFIFIINICNISCATVSMSITSSKTEVKPGESFSVTIKVSGGEGYVNISAENGTVDKNYEWVGNNSLTVNCTAGNSGTVKINVSGIIADSETSNDETKSGSVTININSEVSKSTEARLSNLGIKPNDFSGFKRDKTEYSVEVPNNVTKVNVYATTVDSKAKVTSGTGNVSLKEGNNTVKVTVTAEAGNTKTYTLTIKRATEKEEEEEALEQIEETNNKTTQKFGISKLEIVGITLSPNFDTETYEYTAELNEDLEKLDIDAISTDEDAVIEILGNENLKQGENTITILVRNDEIEKNATYQITVNKNVIVKEEISWLNPSTWGREEIIKLIIIAVLIILVIIAIILKIKIAKEKKDDEDFDLPGGDELDKALAEHQELESTDDYYLQSEFDQEYDFGENNYIEDIAKNKDYKDDIYDNNIKRKGKHF